MSRTGHFQNAEEYGVKKLMHDIINLRGRTTVFAEKVNEHPMVKWRVKLYRIFLKNKNRR